LITLQLVQSLWRIDDQKKHVYEIADLGGKLHDKFVGFAENFESIKTNLDKTQKAYDEAYGQLKDGKGNLINQAKKLKELGINSKKKLPDKLLAAAQEEEVEPDNADISLP
jgi:DNA recombination protein RmuC